MTPPEKTSRILMFLYIGSLIWNVGTSLIRFSVMTFYGRIFRVRGNANSAWVWFYNFVLGIVAVWAVAVLIFDALFECEPIAKFWRPSPLFEDPGSCIEPFVVFLVGSVGNFTVDVLVLIVPMPQVFKLNLPLVKKLGLAFSFVLGYGYVLCSRTYRDHAKTSQSCVPLTRPNDNGFADRGRNQYRSYVFVIPSFSNSCNSLTKAQQFT